MTIMDVLYNFIKDPKLIEKGSFDFCDGDLTIYTDNGSLEIYNDIILGPQISVRTSPEDVKKFARAVYDLFLKQQQMLSKKQNTK